MSLQINSVLRLESRTSPENFDKKSMSFYCDLNTLGFLLGQQEVMLVHTCNKTGNSRKWIIHGTKLYNSLEVRSYRKKPVCVFRY